MVAFVGVGALSTMVETQGIDRFVSGLVGCLEQDFRRWDVFDKSPRSASHSENGVIELMPTSDGELYSFKFVNGHPINTRSGKLTVTAFGALADVATGYPLMISEMTLLTALRTAATSVMAARALARPDSKTMALIGNGAQSEFQAHAFRSIVGIDTIRIFDVDEDAMDKFIANMEGSGLSIVRTTSAAEAAAGADIVTSVTADKTNATILRATDVAPGTHINAVGGDCPGKTELEAALVECSNTFVEYTPQTFIEGEIQQMPQDFPVTELWQVLTGQAPGRLSSEEITLFDSVGFAVEDFSSLRYIWSLLPKHRHNLDLVPEMGNPKDLFGLLGNSKEAKNVA